MVKIAAGLGRLPRAVQQLLEEALHLGHGEAQDDLEAMGFAVEKLA